MAADMTKDLAKQNEYWAIETPEGEIIENSFSKDKSQCKIGLWCEHSTEPMPKGHDLLFWMCEMKAKGFKEVKFIKQSEDSNND